MRGMVATERRVEIVTSSEDSMLLPPYLVAKSPSEVAVGRAWMRVQTWITSVGKWRAVSRPQVVSGPRMSCTSATTIRRHFLMRALKSARESMKPIQMIESGVVAPPT